MKWTKTTKAKITITFLECLMTAYFQPRNGVKQQNRPPQSNPLYKSEIRQPKTQEYMGPISSGYVVCSQDVI